jgi:multidrug resistance efflux pump
VAGLVAKIAADQGDRVKAGDTLTSLEDTGFKQ